MTISHFGKSNSTRLASKPPAPTRSNKLKVEDREFLPAALEILVTPPSPVARSLLIAICALFACAIAWGYFGWIDIYAAAPGKIQPSGRSKIVQPLEGGRVVAIRVQDGAKVNAGDTLVELDPTETAADRAAQARDLEEASGESARRKAAIAAARAPDLAAPPIEFSDRVGEQVREREQNVLIAEVNELSSTIAGLKAQLAEKAATKARLASTIATRGALIALANERVSMRKELDAKGAGSRAQIIEAMETYETQLTSDANDRGQVIETNAAIVSLDRKFEQTVTQFIANQVEKLADAEHKRDHLEQDLIKAQSKASRTELRAPISGVVQELAVSSLGQVIASGQAVATIVPLDSQIEVEAVLANADIGFIEVGQKAVIKVESFPFTRYGTIDGDVVNVSHDAVDVRDASELSDTAAAARFRQPQGSGSLAAGTQSLVFPATIRLAQHTINIDGKDIALKPGMAVTVEIKTGRRRVIDYLLSPLREVASQAARER